METFGKICAAVIVLVFTSIVGGFVFETLWNWFIVTTFQMKQLTLIEAISISFLIGYLRGNSQKKEEEESSMEKLFISVYRGVAWSGIALFIGWIIHLFM